MTIPIARVVGDALRDRGRRRCASATSPHAYRAVRPQRGQPREMLQAGDRARRRARAGGHARRRSTVLCAALDAAGLDELPRRARRRVAVPARCSTASACPTRRAAAILHELVTRDFVGLEREVEALRRARRAASRARRSCAAAPRCSTRVPGGRRRCATLLRRCWPPTWRERVIFDLGLVARRSATTRARCSRSTTPRSARRSAAAGATTTCSGASGATLPACGWALDVERVHARAAGRGAMRGSTDCGSPCRAAR